MRGGGVRSLGARVTGRHEPPGMGTTVRSSGRTVCALSCSVISPALYWILNSLHDKNRVIVLKALIIYFYEGLEMDFKPMSHVLSPREWGWNTRYIIVNLFSSLFMRHYCKFYIYVALLEFSELLYRTIPPF